MMRNRDSRQGWGPRSLRGRMSVGLSLIVGALVLVMFLYLPRRLERQATEALADKGRSMAEMAAYTLSAAVYFDDPDAIAEVLAGVKADSDVLYVGALDFAGAPLGWIGLKRADAIADDRPMGLIGVVAPILYHDRTIGRVEIGLSQVGLQDAIHASRRDSAVLSVALFLAGLVSVLVLGALLERLERANQDLEARFRTIFESSSVGMAMVDPYGRIFDSNPALRRMTGSADIAEHDLADLLAPAERAAIQIWLREFAAGERSLVRAEVRASPRFGDVAWLHVSLSAVRHTDGSLDFISLLVEDITEQRHLVEQLGQSQKMEAVGRLAGGIAHDFNNLLTTINGTAELALGDTPPAALARDLDDILQAGRRAAELTTQLLAFSRRQIREQRLIDLNSVVGETATLLRRMIGEDVQLNVALGDEVPQVLADPGQIGQLLMNLAVNARDAMTAGGSLWIETDCVHVDAALRADLGTTDTGLHAVLRARDTGHGMDAATRARIFEPFFTTKNVGKGTGLGLAMVYGVVRQAGGGIKVVSEPGEGASFSIYLPAAAAHTAVATPAKPEAAPVTTGTGGTLLLVEDEDSVRALVGRVLRRAGYEVVEATNGEHGLAVAATMPEITALVTDVVMPITSGPDMVDRLLLDRPDLRVIYMSGYADAEVLARVKTGRGARLLTKPLAPSVLLETLAGLLEPGNLHPPKARRPAQRALAMTP